MYIFEIIVVVLLLIIIGILISQNTKPIQVHKKTYYEYYIDIKKRDDQLDAALLGKEFTKESEDNGWDLVTVIPHTRISTTEVKGLTFVEDRNIGDPIDLDFYVYRKLIQD